MGYDINKFVEVVDANLLCGICGLVFEDPVLTPCGHSFCLLCLETWLETSQYQSQNRQRFQTPPTLPGSCPECRKAVFPNQAKPELSLRNHINGFYKYCEFKDQGCLATVKLEQSKDHASHCPYSPVICAGCGESVQLINLANHQIHCQGIAETISEGEDCKHENYTPEASLCKETSGIHQLARKKTHKSTDFSELLKQMENEIHILKKDLLLADFNNAIIESEYILHKSKTKKKYGELLQAQGINNHNKMTTPATEPPQTSFQNQPSASKAECHPSTNNIRAGLNWFEYAGDHDVSNASIENEYLLHMSEMKKKYGQTLQAQSINHKKTTVTTLATEPLQTSFQNQSSASKAECHPPTNNNRAGLNWFEYPGGYEQLLPHSIPNVSASRLASFIFRFLLNKPDYIDSRMVFEAIQRCYDHFVSSSSLYENSVHVLVAIAGASDWFTTLQRQHFSQWLQSLAKCRELLDSSCLTRQKKQPII